MKEKDDMKNENNSDDDKIHVTRSVMENAEEIRKKQAEEEERRRSELEKKIAERERKKREAHDKRLEEEHRELIKLKQGIIESSESIEESETIHEEKEIKLNLFRKIGNFFYHNKWWLGIGTVCVFILVYLTVSLVTKPRPDMVVLFIGENQTVAEESELAEYIEGFAEDFNGNGEKLVSVYYIPYTENAQMNYANGVDTKLTAELQTADAVIVFGNNLIDKVLNPEEVFIDLDDVYPENPNVEKYRFSLENTDFAEKIGVDQKYIKDGLFMAVRKPRKLMYSKAEDMQETYDKDFPVFEKIINDLK